MLGVEFQPLLTPHTTIVKLTAPAQHFPCVSNRVSSPANQTFSIDFLQVNTALTSLDMSENEGITEGWAEFAKKLKVSIRASFHPKALEMSTHNQHTFSMHFDPS